MIELPFRFTRRLYKKVAEEEPSSSASEYLLSDGEDEKILRHHPRQTPAWPWMLSTSLLSVALLIVSLIDHPFLPRHSYETGFATELHAGAHVIELEQRRFWGGIRVDPNGSFYQEFNPDEEVRYVGIPTPELDAAWDKMTGSYVPLTKEESESVDAEISEVDGVYLAATASQHHTHCLNYLRQCLYDEHYPDVHVHKENIPDYYLHIDHCIETLRQMVQCAADMTPVPKAWDPIKGIYLANTQLIHTCRKYTRILEWTEQRNV